MYSIDFLWGAIRAPAGVVPGVVREDIQKMQEDTFTNRLKKSLSEAADRLEKRCDEIKQQIFEVKESIKSKAGEIMADFKMRGRASCELEFIVESDNKLFPIDVKKGRGTLNSLEKFSKHNKFEYAIKVSKNNYGYNAEQKLLTIPFYFIPFVAKDLADGTMKV